MEIFNILALISIHIPVLVFVVVSICGILYFPFFILLAFLFDIKNHGWPTYYHILVFAFVFIFLLVLLILSNVCVLVGALQVDVLFIATGVAIF